MTAEEYYNNKAIKHQLKRVIKHDYKYFEDAIIKLMNDYTEDYIKNITTPNIIDVNCPEWLDNTTRAQAKSIWESHKTTDDGLRVKAVKFIQQHAKEHGYEIRISKALKLIKQHCLLI